MRSQVWHVWILAYPLVLGVFCLGNFFRHGIPLWHVQEMHSLVHIPQARKALRKKVAVFGVDTSDRFARELEKLEAQVEE